MDQFISFVVVDVEIEELVRWNNLFIVRISLNQLFDYDTAGFLFLFLVDNSNKNIVIFFGQSYRGLRDTNELICFTFNFLN